MSEAREEFEKWMIEFDGTDRRYLDFNEEGQKYEGARANWMWEAYQAGLASRQAPVEDWQDAIKWNPYNKVVQDHRDGTIHVVATNAVRAVLGLPVPWTQGMGDADAFKEIEGKLSPLAATPEVTE